MKKKSRDYIFRLIINGRQMKFSMNNIKPAPLMLRLKNTIYTYMKTDDVSLPYLTDDDTRELLENGFIELVGTKIEGRLAENARLELIR